MLNTTANITPNLGEGIYNIKDVSQILHLNYQHVRRWILNYWIKNTFGESKNISINFLTLIEFYTFYMLREHGVTTKQIVDLHKELSKIYTTSYPFALAQDFYIENRKQKTFIYYKYLDGIIKQDKKYQISLDFILEFLKKIEFGVNNMAVRFYPLENSQNVVVDPKHQFGQPTVFGTNIKTQTIFQLYKGGEPLGSICNLYQLTEDKVQDSINFHLKFAA